MAMVMPYSVLGKSMNLSVAPPQHCLADRWPLEEVAARQPNWWPATPRLVPGWGMIEAWTRLNADPCWRRCCC